MGLIRLNNQSLTDITSAGLPSGTVIQTVTNSTEGYITGQTNTSLADVTNFSVSTTPRSTSSKILVVASMYVSNALVSGANVNLHVALFRDSTQLSLAVNSAQSGSGGLQIRDSAAFSFLDSPATTSATTYKIQAKTNNSSSAYTVDEGRIIAMEIAG